MRSITHYRATSRYIATHRLPPRGAVPSPRRTSRSPSAPHARTRVARARDEHHRLALGAIGEPAAEVRNQRSRFSASSSTISASASMATQVPRSVAMYPMPTAGRPRSGGPRAVALREEPGVTVELDLAVAGHRPRGDGVAVARREHADVEITHPLGDGAEVVGGKGGVAVVMLRTFHQRPRRDHRRGSRTAHQWRDIATRSPMTSRG